MMDSRGNRCPQMALTFLNKEGRTSRVAEISVCDGNVNFTTLITNNSLIWATHGGKIPLTIPLCGYSGLNCPFNFLQDYLWVIISITAILVIALGSTVLAFLHYYRQRQHTEEKRNLLWQISYASLIPKQKNKKSGADSQRSLQSGPSTTSTKLVQDNRVETEHFMFYIYQNENVVAEKFNCRPAIEKEHAQQLRKLCELDHENLNRFIGLCTNGPIYLACWKYCSRGSIRDVIQRSSINMDAFFIYCLIKDIVTGVHYLHSSFVGFHGLLTSSCCLVNDRWQVKISNFGLPFIREEIKRSMEVRLYTAPEILRESQNMAGSKEGDIYSCAIIFSEMFGRTSAWNLENRKEDAEEIVYKVRKGGRTLFRPELNQHESTDLNPTMLALCTDCWEENPTHRPTTNILRNLLKSMNQGRSENLMDHVFSMMEHHATSLEEEVEERTKQLTEEKTKSDILLYRMLPRQVAEKLKLGQSIAPETYDSVSIFFSDVVSFTALASKCTPLQVVTLLNELYTIFDNVIEQHEVYKVETIGDGYLCVSGLPVRNGTEHIKSICSMSLSLLRALISFRVPHLPTERINIRIGIHTGPCVAGVVGLTMPKYCLFGDSVNTASRMESNGKPGQIHISADANELLLKHYPEFKTESRGEVIIKGKGVMETYWMTFDL